MLEGQRQVEDNLRKAIQQIEGRTEPGLFEAALFVEGEAVRNAPIDTGNLRGSGYTQRVPGGAEVGFTADYAVFVHEIDKNYTVGGWKFLERAVTENQNEILEIIRRRAAVD